MPQALTDILISTGLFNDELSDLSDDVRSNKCLSSPKDPLLRAKQRHLGHTGISSKAGVGSRPYLFSSRHRFNPYKRTVPLSPQSDPNSNIWPSPVHKRLAPIRKQIEEEDLEEAMKAGERKERIEKLGEGHSIHVCGAWQLEDARRCSTGFRGRSDLILKDRVCFSPEDPPEKCVRKLEEAGYDFREVKDVPLLILDKWGRLISVACPAPSDAAVAEQMSRELQDLAKLGKSCRDSKRGDFEVIECGMQFGGGSQLPTPRHSSGKPSDESIRKACERFLNNAPSQHLVKRATDIFMKYFPDLFDYYEENLDRVCGLIPDCFRPLGELPLFSVTLNVGKQCICKAHVDGCNLAGGLCLVSPYGQFDHTKGGHLILHELNLVLALQPGSFILFPSALISHENVPIQASELRQAFTAFSPSQLFLFDSNHFLLAKQTNSAKENTRGRKGGKGKGKGTPRGRPKKNEAVAPHAAYSSSNQLTGSFGSTAADERNIAEWVHNQRFPHYYKVRGWDSDLEEGGSVFEFLHWD